MRIALSLSLSLYLCTVVSYLDRDAGNTTKERYMEGAKDETSGSDRSGLDYCVAIPDIPDTLS